MDLESGDELIVDGDEKGRGARVGRILAIRGSEDHVAYLVHWVAGDYDSLVSPWPGVHVRHRQHHLEPEPGLPGLPASAPEAASVRTGA